MKHYLIGDILKYKGKFFVAHKCERINNCKGCDLWHSFANVSSCYHALKGMTCSQWPDSNENVIFKEISLSLNMKEIDI